jgi:uncharacterized repeat protein (TIGR01451 family)
VPVPSGDAGDRAEVYLSNPNDFPITINAYDAVTQTTFVISPSLYISSTVPYSAKRGGLGYVPQDSAVRFTSSEGVFGVVVAADASDVDYDWGFSGIPAKYLTRDYYVSWAPGSFNIPPTENGSPVWVTPLADSTTFYVDFSPLDGIVDETFTLDVLQQQRIFDPDNDNTGTHVWATSEFAMAWGEDPRTADVTSPYLDLGLTTLPLLQRWLDPVLTLDKTASPTILPSAGGAVTFTLVAHGYNAPLSNVDVSDTLPVNWTYVPDSTHVTYPNQSSGSPAPAQNGRALFWDLSTDLDVNQSLTLTFQAQITSTGGVDSAAYDGFESGDYSGGANWAGDWQEGGDDGSAGGGDVRIVTSGSPFAGSRHLQIRAANNVIFRTVNLSDFVLPTLRFMRRVDHLENGDYFFLDVRDGVGWTSVLTWTAGDLEGNYVHEIVDLVPYASAATAIRFRSGSNVSSGDYFYADQVEVYDSIAASVNRGEAVGKDDYSGTLFSPTDEATVYISSFDLVKSVSSAQAEIGDTLVYTLTYANPSAFTTVTNVTLRDPVPIQHVTFESASDGGIYDPGSGTVIWTLGTLSPGASDTVTFVVKVNIFVQDGTILANVGYIDSDQTQAGSNLVRTTVLAPDVRLHKAGPGVAARGAVMTYTLSYRNIGGTEATGVVISDVIPLSTTYLAGSLAIDTGGGWVALSDAVDDDQGAYISPTLVVAPGTVASGEEGRIRFSVQSEDDLPFGSLILNSAILDRDLDIPRNSNTVVTYISDLLLDKTAETSVSSVEPQATVAPGGVISYNLTYENASETVAQTNVYLREPIPVHTSFIPNTARGGDLIEYSWDNGVTWSATLPITSVTHIRWYDANTSPSTQESASFAVQVNTTLPPNTTIRNSARITSAQTAAYLDEWLPSNQVEVRTVDLWVEKRVSQPAAGAGDLISYTISFGNRGSTDAFGVQIRDMLPANTTYSTGSIWGTGADATGDPMLVWDVMPVMAGAGVQEVGYAVFLDDGLPVDAVITNTATLGSPYATVTSEPATVVITTTAEWPVLSLEKAVSADPVAPGERFTYTLRVVNSGRRAHGLVVSDVVPADASFASCGGAACGLVGDTVVWGPLNLAGAGTTLDLTLAVTAGEELANGWSIVNADYRLVAEDAPLLSGPPVTTTVNLAILSLVKWAFPNEVYAGSRLDYTLLVGNTGGRASHVVISDTLPAHTTFGGCNCALTGLADVPELSPQESGFGSTLHQRPERSDGLCKHPELVEGELAKVYGASSTCSLEGDKVVWYVDEMAGGRSLQMAFWVTVDAALSEGASIVNGDYAVVADHLPPLVGSPPVTTTVHELLVEVSKAAWPNPVTVSQQLFYTITVQNDGSLLQNVTVTDLLPGGVSYVACGGALCELGQGDEPEVRWWLPTLPANSERELTLRVSVGNVESSTLVNGFYGAWIPAAGRRVMGTPVRVKVLNPLWGYLYLPILFQSRLP